MIVTNIYLAFWCHMLLFLLYMIALDDYSCFLMSMYREEVVTSKAGRMLNFKPKRIPCFNSKGAFFE